MEDAKKHNLRILSNKEKEEQLNYEYLRKVKRY